MRYLLDTHVWIVYLKGRETGIRSRLEQTPKDRITTCSVVWAELLHGARKYENPDGRQERVEKVLNPLENFDFNLAYARHYAITRDILEKASSLFGVENLLAEGLNRDPFEG